MPVPVILDTDIGGDIDDTWALAMMLRCPELDVKLVVGDTGNAWYRASLIAKLLEVGGRTDIPVGMGIDCSPDVRGQAPWVRDYDLEAYPGTVLRDGVGAIIDTIMGSPEPVTLICIGPVPNIAEVLKREPRVAENARFVGMHGSVRRGYGNRPEISPECNVVNHCGACQRAFTAPWEITITPLDTCGIVTLEGDEYQAVYNSPQPLVRAIMENYRYWAEDNGSIAQVATKSSILFDTVAIYLAFSEELLKIEELGIRVTPDGYTVIDDTAKTVRVATEWRDLPAFRKLLVSRLVD